MTRLGIQQLIQGLLNADADHLVQVRVDLGLINFDDFAQGFGLVCRFFSNSLAHFTVLQSGHNYGSLNLPNIDQIEDFSSTSNNNEIP
jgi:hypothetical protein